MPNLRLLPLVALAGAFLTGLPAAAADPAATETTAETAPATPAETAAPEPGVPEPVAPDATVAAPAETSSAPASSPSLSEPAAPAAVNPPPAAAAAQVTIEGTKLLFLRLSLRIKRIELELFDAAPEAMVEHLSAAADLLQQLRARYLSDDEALRADRAEQYLQELMLRYTERQAAASTPERKGGKRKR